MTTFNSFSSNETLSVFNMSNIKGGTGKQTNNLGINPVLIGQMRKKYANAGSQSFIFVNKGISYNVVLNSQMHTMTFTNPKGLSYATKY